MQIKRNPTDWVAIFLTPIYVLIGVVTIWWGIGVLMWSYRVKNLTSDQLHNVSSSPAPTSCPVAFSQSCWDGSSVKQQPPTCDFAPCPEIPARDKWKTYTHDTLKYKISYPSKLGDPAIQMDTGREVDFFLDYCVRVEIIPQFLKKPQDYILSNEVQRLKPLETATFKQNHKQEPYVVTTFYTRINDKMIDQVSWKAFSTGNDYEMHAGYTEYIYNRGATTYLLGVGEGGRCPSGLPTQIAETFELP